MTDHLADSMRGLPASPEAEQGVLSCFLQNPDALLEDAVRSLGEDAFYHPVNRQLFSEMLAFQNQENRKPMDLVTFSEFLLSKGLMDKIGGPGFLAELLSFVPTPAHYPYYRGILLDKLRLRNLIAFHTAGIHRCYEHQEDPGKLSGTVLEEAMRLHEDSVPTSGRAGRMFNEVGFSVIDSHTSVRERGIPVGLSWLDMMTGGAQPGHVWVISGQTSDGKSALAEQICMSMAAPDGPAAPGSYYSLEMPDSEVWQRAACNEASIRSHAWTTQELQREEHAALARFMRSKYPVRIYDDVFDCDEICAGLRLDKARRGIRWACIDYVQLAEGDAKEGREREVSKMVKSFKQVAKNLEICIILLSQLNDDGMLRESRAIGQHADKILRLVTREDDDEWRMLVLDKNRGGPRKRKCIYNFIGQYFRFTEVGEVQEDPEDQKKRRHRK